MFSSFKCTDFSFRIHFLKFVLKYDNYFFQALGKDFHSEHFVCVSCNLSLTGHRYVLTGKRMISRKKKEIILYNWKNKPVNFYFYYYFVFIFTDEHPCCIPCYEQNFTHNCRVCERRIGKCPMPQNDKNLSFIIKINYYFGLFSTGLDSKDMSYKDLHWHEECFKCRKCKDSLVEKPFAGKK